VGIASSAPGFVNRALIKSKRDGSDARAPTLNEELCGWDRTHPIQIRFPSYDFVDDFHFLFFHQASRRMRARFQENVFQPHHKVDSIMRQQML